MNESDAHAVPCLIWCPFPDLDTAKRIANSMLDETLVACVNMIPGMVSAFAWDGERGESQETGALLKTNSALLEAAIARLAKLHPYEDPAIVGWRCDAAAPGTVAWLEALGR